VRSSVALTTVTFVASSFFAMTFSLLFADIEVVLQELFVTIQTLTQRSHSSANIVHHFSVYLVACVNDIAPLIPQVNR
jgi:hypothetical protein